MLNTGQSQVRLSRRLLRLRRFWKASRYERHGLRLPDLVCDPVIRGMVGADMTPVVLDAFIRSLFVAVPLFVIFAILNPWDDGPL